MYIRHEIPAFGLTRKSQREVHSCMMENACESVEQLDPNFHICKLE